MQTSRRALRVSQSAFAAQVHGPRETDAHGTQAAASHRRPQPDPRQRPRARRHAPDRPQDPRHRRPRPQHPRAGTARRRRPAGRLSGAAGAGAPRARAQGLDHQFRQRPPPPVRADADVLRCERRGRLAQCLRAWSAHSSHRTGSDKRVVRRRGPAVALTWGRAGARRSTADHGIDRPIMARSSAVERAPPAGWSHGEHSVRSSAGQTASPAQGLHATTPLCAADRVQATQGRASQ